MACYYWMGGWFYEDLDDKVTVQELEDWICLGRGKTLHQDSWRFHWLIIALTPLDALYILFFLNGCFIIVHYLVIVYFSLLISLFYVAHCLLFDIIIITPARAVTTSYLGEENIRPLPRALTVLAKSFGVPSLRYVVSPVPEGTPVRIRRSELTGRTADARTHPLSANPSPGECLGILRTSHVCCTCSTFPAYSF